MGVVIVPRGFTVLHWLCNNNFLKLNENEILLLKKVNNFDWGSAEIQVPWNS